MICLRNFRFSPSSPRTPSLPAIARSRLILRSGARQVVRDGKRKCFELLVDGGQRGGTLLDLRLEQSVQLHHALVCACRLANDSCNSLFRASSLRTKATLWRSGFGSPAIILSLAVLV